MVGADLSDELELRVLDDPTGLEPFRRGVDGPCDLERAAHLARRAGLGAPLGLLRDLLDREPLDACEQFFTDPVHASDEIGRIRDSARALGSHEAARAYWVHRLLMTDAPLRKKLALFWHGHFATSVAKVKDARLLLDQLALLRELGEGEFLYLVLGVAQDPAMIIWLDGNRNRRGNPNENFARELIELFTLGIGNYTEEDIREAARAFTGWHVKRGEFLLNMRAHDPGEKRLFGGGGVRDGLDVIHRCVQRNESSCFIASKLFRFFVHPRPGNRMVEDLGERFRACRRHTGRFLRELFASRVLYAAVVRRSLVASPVDFVIGTLRTLGAGASASETARHLADMGQDLLRPPRVKGWDGGRAWIHSGSLLARLRFAMEICEIESSLKASVPWAALRTGEGESVPDSIVNRLFPGERLEGLRRQVRTLADQDDLVAVLAMCLQSPEYAMV